jgi:uncharacterized protein (DUF58 family)
VSRFAGPKLSAYAVLSAFGLLCALVFARPEVVALTAPFLLALGAGLALASRPQPVVAVELERERALEGDEVQARITVSSRTPVERLELYVRLPDGLEVAEGDHPAAVHVPAGGTRELQLTLRAARWGGHVLGPAYVRARDPFGFLGWETTIPVRPQLRVYPREAALRRVLQPWETQVYAGNEVSRRKGEGIEFADVRPWSPGDTLRRVNWRASARRDELWVNESHPERNTDVILFVDSFAEARRHGAGTLDLAVRATAALADAYIRRRDRIGLIGFGGILRWLVPGMGLVQLYRIVDALIDTEILLSYYWKDIDVIPPRTLPPNALVIALSPLLDPRSVGALLDLRARGYDLAVIDVSPLPFTERPARGLDQVAYDIWTLRREALRHSLQRRSIGVAEWRDGEPLQAAIEEVRSFRRAARVARA